MHTPVIDLQQAAKDHLWLHFARMGAYRDGDVPIIAHGDGCYLEDTDGNRYLDGLAGLFAVQIGYSHGEEVGQAAVEQMRELPFYTNWSYKDPETLATFSDDESESLCAASSPPASSSAASSAVPMTAASPSCRSRRPSSRGLRSSSRSPASSATS